MRNSSFVPGEKLWAETKGDRRQTKLSKSMRKERWCRGTRRKSSLIIYSAIARRCTVWCSLAPLVSNILPRNACEGANGQVRVPVPVLSARFVARRA